MAPPDLLAPYAYVLRPTIVVFENGATWNHLQPNTHAQSRWYRTISSPGFRNL